MNTQSRADLSKDTSQESDKDPEEIMDELPSNVHRRRADRFWQQIYSELLAIRGRITDHRFKDHD